MIYAATSTMRELAIIADTSCLISLSRIDCLHILKDLYSEIYITSEIEIEFGEKLPEWILIRKVTDKKKILSIILDEGEASAIALAYEFEKTLLILDDLKGRREALRLGFQITGTLGVLSKARSKGIIPFLRPYLDKLIAADFRISPEVLEELLIKSGES
jgi:predicted nucleic acid-binding protein